MEEPVVTLSEQKLKSESGGTRVFRGHLIIAKTDAGIKWNVCVPGSPCYSEN